MIRILIRQVMDSRHHAPKSLGIADIEPISQPELTASRAPVDCEVRIYHAPPGDDRLRARAFFTSPKGATADIWDMVIAALQAALNKP